MKLCRFGNPGAETPGILDNEGRIRDLSSACSDINSSVLSPAGLKKLAAVDISRLPIVKNDVRLGVPFRGISKFIGIGLNYSDHAAEAGMPTPTEPIIFLKANSSISGPDDDVIQPRGSLKLDWEVELAVVIGSPARYVSAAVGCELPDAKDHRAGIAALPPHAVDVEPQVEILSLQPRPWSPICRHAERRHRRSGEGGAGRSAGRCVGRRPDDHDRGHGRGNAQSRKRLPPCPGAEWAGMD